MLSFGIPESLTAKGLSYDEYREEMEFYYMNTDEEL